LETNTDTAIPGAGPTPSERRRYARQLWPVRAEMQVGRWLIRRIPVTLRDFSETGAGLELDTPVRMAPNQNVRILWPLPANAGAATPLRLTTEAILLPQVHAKFYGLRFRHLVQEQIELDLARKRRIVTVVVSGLLALIVCYLKMRNVISFWYGPIFQLYSLLAAAYVLSRLGLSMLYKEPEDRGCLKTFTVVLPIKNEETHIEETVRCCFQARYPAHLFEVIAVDDGSTDRTWDILQDLAREFPRLRIFRFEKNKGKRHAMALGAQQASGEIVVYMDSDSQVDPESFYRIIQGFADERVGAVAGHTAVIVDPDNFISKMEAVRYFVSQRVIKAAEGFFGTVTCCPGPLSAYRREAVLRALPSWLNQTFLGKTATFGDDRSLTNKILKEYQVIYHAGAIVRTYVPNRWGIFLRQQLRWKKSWIREATITAPLMLKEPPLATLSYFLGLIVTVMSPFIVLRVFLYAPLALGTVAWIPYYIAGLFLVFLLLGLAYFYHTRSRYWYYGLAFAVFYAWFFSLQTYYALLTVRRTHWGTR
jgi:hyaluronan synthase